MERKNPSRKDNCSPRVVINPEEISTAFNQFKGIVLLLPQYCIMLWRIKLDDLPVCKMSDISFAHYGGKNYNYQKDFG